jgi:hypothetical protein
LRGKYWVFINVSDIMACQENFPFTMPYCNIEDVFEIHVQKNSKQVIINFLPETLEKRCFIVDAFKRI